MADSSRAEAVEAKSGAPLKSALPPPTDTSWFEGEIVALLPDLYATALRFTRSRTDAEDLVAETLKNAWARLSTLRDRGCFRGWMFRVLTSTFCDDRRRRKARPEIEPISEGEDRFSIFEQLHQPYLLWWGNPEQQLLNHLLREDLARAIRELPEAFRMAVVLSDVNGFSYQEIAEMLGAPIGTVRSRLARGRALLQKALWEHALEAGLVPRTVRDNSTDPRTE